MLPFWKLGVLILFSTLVTGMYAECIDKMQCEAVVMNGGCEDENVRNVSCTFKLDISFCN